MGQDNYKVIFSGQIKEGEDLKQVKKKVAALLKLDSKGVARFFSGKPITVKKAKDIETARKYQKILESKGALSELEHPESQDLTAAAPPKPPSPATPSPEKEMVACPQCSYKQRPSAKCIMCGMAMAEAEPMEITKKTETAPAAPRPNLPKLRPGTIIMTNIEHIPGRDIVEHYGLVSGSTIRAKHIGRDIMASLKNLVGGELKGYTQLLQESREEATDRMKEQARQMGANAIINVRYSTSSLAQGAAELYAYGTAVLVE